MVRKALNIFLIISVLLGQNITYAQQALLLEPLIEEARKNNPQIQAAKKRYEGAKARIPQASSLDDPAIGLTFEKTPGSPFKLNKTMSEDRMLSLSQMLPWFGKLPLKKKIALVESQMFAAEIKNTELEVINDLKKGYFDLFMNTRETELREQSLEFLKSISAIAESKYIVGEIGQEDLFKINLEISLLINNINNLKKEKESKTTFINAILNRDPEAALGEPVLVEELVDFNQDIDYLYRLTLENQPELSTFNYAIEKNKYEKSLAKRNFFPDLMAGIVMRGITTGSIGPWDLMLAFTVPLWFWTKQRYQVKEAIASLEEAQLTYQAMENKALAETKDLVTRLEIAGDRFKLYKESQIPLLESSITVSLSLYSSGKQDLGSLLEDERMLIEAKMEYYRALVEYNMRFAELNKQIGLDLSGAGR